MINGVLLDKLSVGQDLFAKRDYAGARVVFEGMVPVGVARLGPDHQTRQQQSTSRRQSRPPGSSHSYQ